MQSPQNSDSPHWELSGQIIQSAQNVLNSLKPGLGEKLYENALVISLRKQGLTVEQQREFPVYYEGEKIGELIPDLIVDENGELTGEDISYIYEDMKVAFRGKFKNGLMVSHQKIL